MHSLRVFTFALVSCLVAPQASAFADGEVDSPYSSIGLDAHHAALTGAGSEQIDPFTGSVNLGYTDVHIPGAFGLDLDVVRTYSSKVVDENMSPYLNTWVGQGWTLQFGRMRFDSTLSATDWVWIQLPGQGMERAFALATTDALYRGPTDANAFPGQSARAPGSG